MKLTRFSVQGFKNITRELVLDDLRDVNVIHGPNSVGKSNLMQAIGLIFLVLGKGTSRGVSLNENDLRTLGMEPADAWPINELRQLNIRATLSFSPPVKLLGKLTDRVDIGLKGMPPYSGSLCLWVSVVEEGAKINYDFQSTPSDAERQLQLDLRQALAEQHRSTVGIDQSFCLINTERSAEVQALQRDQNEEVSLALEMYDSLQSEDLARARRWRAFQTAMGQFTSVTGPGEFIVTYQRVKQSARLLFENERARLPLRSLGSGVQQLVALFGRILMSRASIIAIEEPELNLRWNLQKQISQVLQSLTRDQDSGIRQLFITSHSPAFESGDDFWLMEPGVNGPTISRRPRRDLPSVLGPGAVEPDLPESAVPTWISSQGVLEVPPRVRKALDLEHGGSVMFEERADGVLMRNQDRAFEDVFGAAETHAD